MTPFAIAGVQMQIAAGHENVTAMAHKIDYVMARFPWVQMILFSELATFGPLPDQHPDSPEETLQIFCEAARRHNVWLLPGSLHVKDRGQLFNESVVINPAGEIIVRYRKMFPFAPYEAGVAGGDEVVVFDVPDVGRSVCRSATISGFLKPRAN